MKTLAEIRQKYHKKLDSLDLELLIADTIGKSREFVLSHPEYTVNKNQESRIKNYATRRIKNEPLAYILGHKEFFGLDFTVTPDTLIPRPETELLVELAIQETRDKKQETNKKQDTRYNPKYSGQNTKILDVGTGSGNIIISLAKNLENKKVKFFGIDISEKALRIARYNAKKHQLDKKIKFLKGNLLDPLLKNKKIITHNSEIIILANLPYLSKKIYSSAPIDVRKYEPKSALLSGKDGLDHYQKLFLQIKKITTNYQLQTTIHLEISPEQKPKITKLAKKFFPHAKIEFKKDLAGKWRLMVIEL